MKKNIILSIISVLLLSTLVVRATVIKRKINEDTNPVLTNNILMNMHRDVEGRIWIATNSHLIHSKDSTCTEWSDYSDTIANNMLYKSFTGVARPDFRAFHLQNDKYGNMIYHSFGGIGIFYKDVGDWDFFTRDNPDLKKYLWVAENGFSCVDSVNDRVYLAGFRDSIKYITYDSVENRYKYDGKTELEYWRYSDSIKNIKAIENIGDSLWIVTTDNILIKDLAEDSEFSIIEYTSSFDLTDKFRNAADNSFGVIDILPNEKRILMYRQRYVFDSVNYDKLSFDSIIDMRIEGGKVHTVYEVDLNKVLPKSESYFYEWIDEDRDSLFVGNYSEMWIFDVRNNSLSKIPCPAEFGEDVNQEWAARHIMIFPEKNELWLGNSNYCITVYNLTKILESAVPVGIIDNDVEVNPEFPMLGGARVHPIPASGSVYIDFYQQVGYANEIKISIFDTTGKQYGNIPGHVVANSKLGRTAIIPTGGLSRGVYIVLLRYKNYSCTAKILI